jgi:hypothetical protein
MPRGQPYAKSGEKLTLSVASSLRALPSLNARASWGQIIRMQSGGSADMVQQIGLPRLKEY